MRILLTLIGLSCAGPATAPPPHVAAQPAVAAPAAAPTAGLPASLVYPRAPPGNIVEIQHGAPVADPYRWLEDMGSETTRQWVAAQNALTDSYESRLPGRETLHRRIAELVSYESFRMPVRRARRYFWTYSDGTHDQPVVCMASSLDARPRVVLDINEVSTDGSLAFVGFVASWSGTHLAYGLAAGAGDWQTWRIRDVATGKDLPDELTHIKYYRPVFHPDGTGLYYSRFPAPPAGRELVEPDHDAKIYFHRLGTSAAQDAVIYERPDHPSWQFDLAITSDRRYLVITTGDGEVGDRRQELISILDLQRPGARPVPLIDRYDAEYLFVGSRGPVLYVQTNLDAANKRIVAIDTRAPERKRWTAIIPEGATAIESTSLVGSQIFVTTLRDAHHAIAAYDLQGRKLRDIALPGLGSVLGVDGDAEAFYLFAGFTTPSTVYRYNTVTGASTPWNAPQVAFDPSAFETRQVFFAGKDGTRIPMFLTAKKGLALDGARPSVLTAYGIGGVSSTPRFSAALIAWLERGGVYALANIRGGGEYGDAWHAAAKRATRQVAYDDFLAAADWLVANRVTSPAHLGVFGASGGGMLVAGAVMQRPALFGAAIPQVGVHDLLRFHRFGEGAGWIADLGSPDDPAEHAVLRATSPLHNVRAGTRYPAMLVVTADHDVRVAPLHSYKLAAALQAAQAASSPVLLRVLAASGHNGGTTRSQLIEQQTERYLFLAANLGLPLE